MTAYEFITLLYTFSVVFVGFHTSQKYAEIKTKFFQKAFSQGKPCSDRQASFSVLAGIAITSFVPIFNTWMVLLITISLFLKPRK